MFFNTFENNKGDKQIRMKIYDIKTLLAKFFIV